MAFLFVPELQLVLKRRFSPEIHAFKPYEEEHESGNWWLLANTSFNLRSGFTLSRFYLHFRFMHQSIPAAPMPPPRANPRALAFFYRMANSRGWGHFSCQIPRGVDEGRGQMPNLRDRTPPINTAAVFIHCTIIPLSAILCVIFHFCRPTSPSSIVCNGTTRC